jgi:hypothetical protein
MARGNPGRSPGAEHGRGEGGQRWDNSGGVLKRGGYCAQGDEPVVQPGAQGKSEQCARDTGDRADDQGLAAQESADLAGGGGHRAEQGEFTVALLDGEREGADDHEDRHEQRGAAHRTAHTDQPDPGRGGVQELDGAACVAGGYLGGGAELSGGVVWGGGVGERGDSDVRRDRVGVRRAGSVQRRDDSLPQLGRARALGREDAERGDLPGVTGQTAGLGGGEEE